MGGECGRRHHLAEATPSLPRGSQGGSSQTDGTLTGKPGELCEFEESACKHVGQQRLKRAGMRWNKEHAEYVAHIRTHRLNGRWEEFWQQRYLRAA